VLKHVSSHSLPAHSIAAGNCAARSGCQALGRIVFHADGINSAGTLTVNLLFSKND